MFSCFEREELCQFYIYPMIPDTDKCGSYFRITDKDVLRSYYKFRVLGKEIEITDDDLDKHGLFENSNDKKIYQNKNNGKPLRKLARDMMWKLSHWNIGALHTWIERERPDCIFLAPGYQGFIYDIAEKISKRYSLPIVSYICDDYYFVKKPKSLMGKIQTSYIQGKIRKMMRQSAHTVTICDSLRDSYEKEFGCPTSTIMTGKSLAEFKEASPCDTVKGITYMGNVRCNRYIGLVEIGKALKSINERLKTDYKLYIYTSEKDSYIIGLLESVPTIKLCGFVNGEDYERTLCSSGLLLHTEAFDEESIDLVRNSISTKIADSLSSGVCLIGYGPKQVASMAYLIKSQGAFCITEEESLEGELEKILTDKELRNSVLEKAILAARENHDDLKNSQRLKEIMKKTKKTEEKYRDR
ncbi:MAG: hypothetical protein IJ039_09125 [Clostridia bacterium]|nr:hypothetical protein [Clostridia bacterium]